MVAFGSSRAKPARILVVESDRELRGYLVEALADLDDAVVSEASSLPQAAGQVDEDGVDLVVGAVDGPCGGTSLCSTLQIGGREQVPVLLIRTGVSSLLTGRDLAALETTTVLEAPVSAAALCGAVESILPGRSRRPGRRERKARSNSKLKSGKGEDNASS